MVGLFFIEIDKKFREVKCFMEEYIWHIIMLYVSPVIRMYDLIIMILEKEKAHGSLANTCTI